jgi:tetratricopeptide (TPR) repeat protein
MAIRQTNSRRTQFFRVLTPFRKWYLGLEPPIENFQVSGDGPAPAWQRIDLIAWQHDSYLKTLHELVDGKDQVAMWARINLADYYLHIDNVNQSLSLLKPAVSENAPKSTKYTANMLYSAINLQTNQHQNIEEAITHYRNAALSSRSRDKFCAAYDGIEASIVLVPGDRGLMLPARDYFP